MLPTHLIEHRERLLDEEVAGFRVNPWSIIVVIQRLRATEHPTVNLIRVVGHGPESDRLIPVSPLETPVVVWDLGTIDDIFRGMAFDLVQEEEDLRRIGWG